MARWGHAWQEGGNHGRQTREYSLKLLQATQFPPVERHGYRGQAFVYPEWLIMLIGVLAVKGKEPTHLGIHRMTCRFWHDLCGRRRRLPTISESQLRARLQKSATSLERLQDMGFKSFLQRTSRKVVGGDTMMNKAWGPVWPTKHKAQGLIPGGKSQRDGRVYGHGSFCMASHSPWVLGAFKDTRTGAREAKRLWLETGHLQGVITMVIMGGKADDPARFAEFQRQG